MRWLDFASLAASPAAHKAGAAMQSLRETPRKRSNKFRKGLATNSYECYQVRRSRPNARRMIPVDVGNSESHCFVRQFAGEAWQID